MSLDTWLRTNYDHTAKEIYKNHGWKGLDANLRDPPVDWLLKHWRTLFYYRVRDLHVKGKLNIENLLSCLLKENKESIGRCLEGYLVDEVIKNWLEEEE
ncbi:MAG: hypothetical protein KAI17_03435 [Thiotrichaceae bacterium]|nr:hypothetical protein [Thiotrichaceae bacterium]